MFIMFTGQNSTYHAT